VFVLLMTGSAIAQKDNAAIALSPALSGVITSTTGAAVSNAVVVLGGSGDYRKETKSGERGEYFFRGVTKGTYSLTVSAEHFAPKTMEYIAVNPDDPLLMDVSLDPTVAPEPAAIPSATGSTQASVNSMGGGKINGTVTDPTQAVISGALVTLTSSTGFKKETKTNDRGVFTFEGLPDGSYTLTITAANFAAKTMEYIQLAGDTPLTLDASLEPPITRSEVNVEGSNAGQVEVETATVSGTISQKQLTTFGLNGRNFTQLIVLAPGVSNQSGQDEAKVGVQGSVKYSVNGGRVEYNTFDIDGSDVLNTGLNGAASTLMVYPSLDAIQEVKVLTSNYGAQYGRTASGTVLVTTKSGTKAYHGNVYWFDRNEFFNARNFFDIGSRAPLYRRQDFGGTIGGPLSIGGIYNKKKDRTFFFFSEEMRLEKTPTDFNQAVPSLKERGLVLTANGIQNNLLNSGSGQVVQIFDFSDVCPLAGALSANGTFSRQIYPDCPSLSSTGGQAKAISSVPQLRNALPASLISKNALQILSSNLLPLPNSSVGCNYGVTNLDPLDPYHCYNAAISPATYWREELFRIDHNVTNALKLSFRYIHDAWDTTVLSPQWSYQHQNFPSVATFPTVQNRFVGPGLSLVGSMTNIISSKTVNNLVLSYVNSTITLVDQNGPGGAQYQLNPSLYQPLVQDPANPRVCNPVLSVVPPLRDSPAIPQCGLGYIFNNGFGGKMPGVAILGTNAAYGGAGFAIDTSYMPWGHTNPTYSVRDDISKSIGKHTLYFGAQYVYSQRNQTNNVIGAASGEQQGLLSFSNLAHSTGNAFADFLIETAQGCANQLCGFIQSYTQDSGQGRYYQRYQLAEPYFQDDWRVSQRLTLNLGARLSLFGTYSEKNHNVWNWVPSQFNANRFAVDANSGVLLERSMMSPISIDPSTFQLDQGVIKDLGLVQCGMKGTPGSCMKGHLFNLAPRIGIAWDPRGDGKMSIRAGYGMFYEHGTGNEANTGSLEASSPVVLSMTQPSPVNYMCIGNVGFGGGNNSVCSTATAAAPPPNSAYPLDVTAIPTKAVWPYVQQWSLSAQRELSKGLMLDVAYVGSRGTHLTVARQLNQAQPLPPSENPFGPHEPLTVAECNSWNGITGVSNPSFLLANGTSVTQQNPAYVYLEAACTGVPGLPNVNSLPNRPYPGLGRIYSLENVATSSYNALQFKLQRTSKALSGAVIYVYSHSIDNSSDRSDPVLVNSYDLRSNRASSDFDQRHSVTANFVYSIPSIRLRSLLRFWSWGSSWDWDCTANCPEDGSTQDSGAGLGRWGEYFLGGWQLSGLTVFQSGTPFTVINSAGNTGISLTDNAGVASGLGIAASYPDLASVDPGYSAIGALSPVGVTSQNFGPLLRNPSQFVAPRGLTFGNAGRNFLNNPNRFNVDVTLSKNFKITERTTLEFRAEVFNVFNNTQFRIYDANNPGSAGNNVISCYAGPQYSAGYWAGGGPNCITGASFLHPVDAHRPRTMQFGLKLGF
jgi:hypothetical protein